MTDVWTGDGDWNANPAKWSLGKPPTLSESATVAGDSTVLVGSPKVSDISAVADDLTVGGQAQLSLIAAHASLHVAQTFDNIGRTTVEGNDQTVTIGGAFMNTGSFNVGAVNLAGVTKVTAATFKNFQNTGVLNVQGDAAGTTGKAIFDITGACPSDPTGAMIVSGDGEIEFRSGDITDIASTAWLELNGADASIATNSGAASALADLASNEGVMLLNGDSALGAGGVHLTTKVAFENHNSLTIDDAPVGKGQSPVGGGSVVTFGGKLFNESGGNGSQPAVITIGNVDLSASTTVKATDLENDGSIVLQGEASANADHQAVLAIAGSADQALGRDASLRISGDAALEFSSAFISGVSAGDTLELDGAKAKVFETSNPSLNPFGFFGGNLGTLILQGDSQYGAGGVTLDADTAFQNSGTFDVDSVSGDGGSNAIFEQLQNLHTGIIDIGNADLVAATTLESDAGLVNNGSLTLTGGPDTAEVIVKNGSAQNSGSLVLNAHSELDVTALESFVQTAGGATIAGGTLVAGGAIDVEGGIINVESGKLGASALNLTDGVVIFNDVVSAADVTAALNIDGGPKAIAAMQFSSAVSGHVVDFEGNGSLALGDPVGFKGEIEGFHAGDAITLLNQTVTSFSYSGTTTSGALTLDGAHGVLETLSFIGDYKKSSFNVVAAGGDSFISFV